MIVQQLLWWLFTLCLVIALVLASLIVHRTTKTRTMVNIVLVFTVAMTLLLVVFGIINKARHLIVFLLLTGASVISVVLSVNCVRFSHLGQWSRLATAARRLVIVLALILVFVLTILVFQDSLFLTGEAIGNANICDGSLPCRVDSVCKVVPDLIVEDPGLCGCSWQA